MICIQNGMIYDAVSKEPYKADLLLEEGKIKKIGKIEELPEGSVTINAEIGRASCRERVF